MTQLTLWQAQKAGLSKTELIKNFANLTPLKIIKAGFPSISALSRDHSPERIEKAIHVLAVDFSSSFNKGLKTHHIEELVAEIMSNRFMRSMSLEDVYCALRELKINNSHGDANLNKVLKHLSDYNKNRMQLVASEQLNNHYSEQFNSEKHSLLSESKKNKIRKEKHTLKDKYFNGTHKQ